MITDYEEEVVPGGSGISNMGPGAEENCTPGMPAKRRKKEDKYRVFESEEKECLKKYDNLESSAKTILCSTFEKLFPESSQDNTPEGIMYLRERLDTTEKNISLDPICIGFLGCTGTGKTCLLNALIGKKLFLPVGGIKPCTSCIVQVKRSRSELYEAVIHLVSEKEWREELKTLVKILQKNEDDEDDEDDDEDENTDDENVKDALDKLRAIYGSGAEKKSYEELLNAKLQVTIPPKRNISIKEKEVEQFSEKLAPYIRVSDKDSVALWPLFKYVEVSIPNSDMIPEGIIFVDIPGIGDINQKRDEMWKQSIDECSFLWVIGDIGRIDGVQGPPMLLNECIKACLGGNCTDIAIVATKSDVLDLDEYKKGDRGNKTTPINDKHEAILERNETVKNTMEERIRDKLKKKLPSDSDVINKPNLVYTVSAKEFWNPKHLVEEETEIPKLREYIRKLYLKERERLVNDFIKEIVNIYLLAENIGSKEPFVELHIKESGVEGFVNEKINALTENLNKCFSQLDQPLIDGVANARKCYEKTVSRILTRAEGYKGFHKTLKAVCLKNGEFPSKTFARIDLNEDLANPIYDKIASIFGSIFRMDQPTRTILWSHLEVFKKEVNDKIHQTAKDRKIPDDNGKIKAFTEEMNIILKRLKKKILQRKTVIWKALPQSIQNSLKPHYEEASMVKGNKACDNMKKILKDSIGREVANNMFENAKLEMKKHIVELEEEITMTLRSQISMLLKLLFLQQDQLAVKLSDIEQECKAIKELSKEICTRNGE